MKFKIGDKVRVTVHEVDQDLGQLAKLVGQVVHINPNDLDVYRVRLETKHAKVRDRYFDKSELEPIYEVEGFEV